MLTTEEESMFAGFMTCLIVLVVSGLLITIGTTLPVKGNIERGRNAGIIYCTEQPKQCATEYNYLKLKEAKK